MPRSHIHGSPRRFFDGVNLTDDPGYVNILCPIRMLYGATTVFVRIYQIMQERNHFVTGVIRIVTVRYKTMRFNTEITRFNAEQYVSRRVYCGWATVCYAIKNKNCLIRNIKNHQVAIRTLHDNQSVLFVELKSKMKLWEFT
jgi:hypothetical protein